MSNMCILLESVLLYLFRYCYAWFVDYLVVIRQVVLVLFPLFAFFCVLSTVSMAFYLVFRWKFGLYHVVDDSV